MKEIMLLYLIMLRERLKNCYYRVVSVHFTLSESLLDKFSIIHKLVLGFQSNCDNYIQLTHIRLQKMHFVILHIFQRR